MNKQIRLKKIKLIKQAKYLILQTINSLLIPRTRMIDLWLLL
jgi:hypothetical protein